MTAELFEFERVVVVGDADARIIDDVSTVVHGAGVTVLAGPSGSGKSTLLRLCNRLTVPTSGVVRYRGKDVAALDPLAHRRRVGMVFQRPTLFAGSVRDNLLVACPDANGPDLVAALRRVDLAGFLDRSGDDLSGGEAQRVCLARTLITAPEVLLLDEPTSSLDPGSTILLERLVRNLCGDGVAVMWVTHDLAQARRLADRCIVVLGGRIADPARATAWLAAGTDGS